MEDNILKLMRELGELKMQEHELKAKVKKEIDDQQRIIELQKHDLEVAKKELETLRKTSRALIEESVAQPVSEEPLFDNSRITSSVADNAQNASAEKVP